MELVADLGNSRLKLALIDGGGIVATSAIASDLRALPRVLREFVSGRPPSLAALVSVVPQRTAVLAAAMEEALGLRPRVVGADLPVLIPNDTLTPERVGCDRLMNATWAARTHPGRDVIVISMGTAVTFDVVRRGAFVGGAIALGLRGAARALSEATAQLPEIVPGVIPVALGRNTAEAIAAGLVYGAAGAIQRLCAELGRELRDPLLVPTGGDAALLAPLCRGLSDVVPGLTLLGVWFTLMDAAPCPHPA